MPAQISIAMPLNVEFGEVPDVVGRWAEHGVTTTDPHGYDGTLRFEARVDLGRTRHVARIWAYDEQTWCSATVDIDEEEYDRWADRVGRALARDLLVALAAQLGSAVAADYVHLGEEVEAERGPGQWTPEHLLDITLVHRDMPGALNAGDGRDLLLTRDAGEYRVFFRLLDPVPHHPAATPGDR